MATAVSVLFFTETFGTQYGMGYYIMDAWLRVSAEMYAGILVLSIMGLLLFGIIDCLSMWLAAGSGSEALGLKKFVFVVLMLLVGAGWAGFHAPELLPQAQRLADDALSHFERDDEAIHVEGSGAALPNVKKAASAFDGLTQEKLGAVRHHSVRVFVAVSDADYRRILKEEFSLSSRRRRRSSANDSSTATSDTSAATPPQPSAVLAGLFQPAVVVQSRCVSCSCTNSRRAPIARCGRQKLFVRKSDDRLHVAVGFDLRNFLNSAKVAVRAWPIFSSACLSCSEVTPTHGCGPVFH